MSLFVVHMLYSCAFILFNHFSFLLLLFPTEKKMYLFCCHFWNVMSKQTLSVHHVERKAPFIVKVPFFHLPAYIKFPNMILNKLIK